jgi:tetratricopeptide (TPR) repeat protein
MEPLLQRASQLRQAGRIEEAIDTYEQLLAARPELPDSWYNLGWLRRQARRFPEALAAYSEALRRGVNEPEEVHLNRAVILADHLGRADEAHAELEAALRLNPHYVPALLNLGNLAEDRGRRGEARAAYERALAVEPGNRLALARLAGIADVSGPDDPIVARLRAALGQPGLEALEAADLGFALGRVLDSAGAYDDAFAAYRFANRVARTSFGPAFRSYDRREREQFVDRIIAAFPEPAREDPTRRRNPELVFICGMFRSGSTLAEQILARHPAVTPGGELDLVPAIVERELQPYPEAAGMAGTAKLTELRRRYLDEIRAIHPDASLVTDKRPDNFLHIGLIKAMMPEARIVHTVRHPLDNILSVYFLHLDPGMAYALDLEDAAHWYGQYRRLMRHWKSLYPEDIFDLDYDALVADPKPHIEALLTFCALGWDDACLDFHMADNVVKTASAWQVREPLYRRASGRWRHYARHLEPIRRRLDEFQSSAG